MADDEISALQMQIDDKDQSSKILLKEIQNLKDPVHVYAESMKSQVGTFLPWMYLYSIDTRCGVQCHQHSYQPAFIHYCRAANGIQSSGGCGW